MKLLKWFFPSLLLTMAVVATAGYLYLYVLPTGPERTATRPMLDGKDSFVMRAYQHTDRKTIRVWSYKPQQWTENDPVLFVMHGMGRNAEEYLDAWQPIAEERRLLLIAPEFESKFARVITNDYQEGNLWSYFGWSNPESEWAFTVVENIFDHVNRVNGFSVDGYSIFGHSAGGQFVQRMVAAKSGARIKTAIAANAGSYSFMDEAVPYPYGLGALYPDVGSAFAKRLIILLGELDNSADAGGRLDQTEPAMRQGGSRLERGQNFFASAEASAAQQDLQFNWRLQVVPGVGHDFRRMSAVAATFF